MRLLCTLYCPDHNMHQDFRGLIYGKTLYLPLDHNMQENITEHFPEKSLSFEENTIHNNLHDIMRVAYSQPYSTMHFHYNVTAVTFQNKL